MKKTVTTFAFLFLTYNFLSAQPGILKMIENKKFEKAEKELVKDLEKNPESIVSNYTMAMLLINRDNTGYNPEKAWEFLMKASTRFRNETDEKVLKNLAKIPVGQTEIAALTDTIASCALEDAIQKSIK